MSACDAQNFNNVNAAVWQCIVETVRRELDVVISGPQGCESKDTAVGEFTFCWEWDGSSNLSVVVTKKPVLVPCSLIASKVNDAIRACGGK